jgi:hypothetical protein
MNSSPRMGKRTPLSARLRVTHDDNAYLDINIELIVFSFYSAGEPKGNLF